MTEQKPKKKIGRPRKYTPNPLNALAPPSEAPNSAYGGLTTEKEAAIAKIMECSIEDLKIIASRPAVDKNDLNDIMTRTFDYLERKLKQKRLPSIEGLASWLGLPRETLRYMTKNHKDKEIRDFLNVVSEQFSAMWTESAQTGETNPVAWIFYAKNHFNYVDKQEIEVDTTNHDEGDSDEIRRRWLLEKGVHDDKAE